MKSNVTEMQLGNFSMFALTLFGSFEMASVKHDSAIVKLRLCPITGQMCHFWGMSTSTTVPMTPSLHLNAARRSASTGD